MEKLGIINFTGLSGRAYTFNVYPVENEFKAKGAIYFLTQRSVNNDGTISHKKLYIGASENLHETMIHLKKTVEEDEINSVCTYWEDSDHLRKEIEEDLAGIHKTPSLDSLEVH